MKWIWLLLILFTIVLLNRQYSLFVTRDDQDDQNTKRFQANRFVV